MQANNQAMTQTDVLQAMNPKSLVELMSQETERREVMNKYIAHHLKEDTDYGTIVIAGRKSKPCLFKPGAEKFCSLLQLRAEFKKDEETLSMLADAKDQIAYVCHLVHIGTGQVIAEGRGSCSPKEKQGIVNTAIKIAEKRAQIDAVLRLGFSDSFTQDLEDIEETPAYEPVKAAPKPAQSAPVKVEDWREVTFHFGKNKGKKLGEVPPDYIHWLIENWQPKSNSTADQLVQGALDAFKNQPYPYLETEPLPEPPPEYMDPSNIPF